jgi:serine/threonine protein kinase
MAPLYAISSPLPRQVDDPSLQRMIHDNLNRQFNAFAGTCARVGVREFSEPDLPSTTFRMKLIDADISIGSEKIQGITIKIFHGEDFKMQLWQFMGEHQSISYLLDSRTAGRSFIPVECFLLPYFNGDEFEILSSATEQIPQLLPLPAHHFNETLLEAVFGISQYLGNPLITALEVYNDDTTLGHCILDQFPNIVSYHAVRYPASTSEPESGPSHFYHHYISERLHQHHENTLTPQLGEKVNLMIIRNLICPARISIEEGIELIKAYKDMLTPDGFMIISSNQLSHIGQEHYEQIGFEVLNMGKLCLIMGDGPPESHYQPIYILRHKSAKSMWLTAEKVYLVHESTIETDKLNVPKDDRKTLFKLPSGELHDPQPRMIARGSFKSAWLGSVHLNPEDKQVWTTEDVFCEGIEDVDIPLSYEQALLEKLQGSQYIVNALGFYRSKRTFAEKHGITVVDDKRKLTAIWENMDGGTLGLPKIFLEIQNIVKVLSSTLKGLKELHHFGFIHLDLHMDNIFLDSSGQAKLGDLGSARPTDEISDESKLGQLAILARKQIFAAKPEQLAPEVIENMIQVQHKITTKADIFPVGVMLWNLVIKRIYPSDNSFDKYLTEYVEVSFDVFCGWAFYKGKDLLSRIADIKKCFPDEPPEPDLLRHLAWEMLHVDPTRRPSAAEAADRMDALGLSIQSLLAGDSESSSSSSVSSSLLNS